MTIAYPSDRDIGAVAAGLLDHSLPKAQWTHAAHFGATLWLLRYHPGFDGGRDLPGIIRGYCGRSDWLLAHWSAERLFNTAARRTWLAPDLAPI